MRVTVFLFLQCIAIMCIAEELNLDRYISASMEGLTLQTESHHEIWDIGAAESWNVDQNLGLIWWTFSDGRKAFAPVQIIGTYSPDDGTFMWGWDHPSVQPKLRVHARKVKEFGEIHRISRFTTMKIRASEKEAWEFVAIANRLANANGGYRADAGGPLVFMTYGEITLQKDTP